MIEKTLKINNQLYYIYLENGKYKLTTKENFNSYIEDARQTQTFQGFTNVIDVVEYIQKYFSNVEVIP